MAPARPRGGRLLRAGIGRRPRRAARRRAGARRVRGRRDHRKRAEGPGDGVQAQPATGRGRPRPGRDRRRRVTIRVRAPATTANVGPGFDCAGIALDLWNEVEVREGSGATDERHLGVRAFARVSSPRGRVFEWTDRIPRARGLGSSAAVVALGLVAGALAEDRDPDPEWLLYEGVDLEGHTDNLAPALAGGVCLTWDGRIQRVADTAPAVPVALIPETTVSTS